MTRLIIIIAPNAPRSDELISVFIFLFPFFALRVCFMNEIENRAPIAFCLVGWVSARCSVCAKQTNTWFFLFKLICKYWAFSHLLVSHTAIENSSKYQWQIDEFSSNLYLLLSERRPKRLIKFDVGNWCWFECAFARVADAFHCVSRYLFFNQFFPFDFGFASQFVS